MSLVSISELLGGARPDTYCVAIRGSHRITLARLRADISQNADRLSKRSIRSAAVVCDDGYWFLVGVLALVKIGAEVILPPNSQAGTLRGLAQKMDALLTDSDAGDDVPKRIVLESSMTEAAPIRFDAANGRVDFFTSGSTGEMKRVAKSLALFEREAAVLEQMWGAEIGDAAVFGTVTHQHVFGMTFRIMWPLLAGRPFHSESYVAWEPLLAMLATTVDLSMIISSPAQLSRLAGLAPVAASARPRMIVTAGAPLHPDAAIETREIFGCVPTEIFGSTEAGVIAWRRGPTQPALWQAFPSVEIAATSEGVLKLRSPHSSEPGWCEQSDRISLAPDGRFSLEGRTDRVVKIEGKRVSLERLERQITALAWVEEAAVVRLGERRAYLGAVLKLSEAGNSEIERLGKFRFERLLRRELSSTEDLSVLPRRWRFVANMPIDGLGKRRVRDVVAVLEHPA